MRIRRQVVRTLHLLALPLRREWVFVAVMTVLLGASCVNAVRDWPSHCNADYMLLDCGGVLRAYAEAYLLAALMTVTGWRWLRWPLYVAAAVVAWSAWAVYGQFGLDISPLMVTLVAETDAQETAGFFRAFFGRKMVAALVGMAAVLALAWAAERYSGTIGKLLRVRNHALGMVCRGVLAVALVAGFVSLGRSLTVLGAQSQEELEERFVTFHSDSPMKILHAFKAVCFMSDESKAWLDRVRADYARPGSAVMTGAVDTLDIVVVIGESYIRSHSQLYGYPMATTPYQLAERDAGRLVAFDSVTGVSRHTSPAIRSVLSLGCTHGGDTWQRSPFVPALFSRAGWPVYMLDNQKADDGQIYSFTLNSFLYNDFAIDSCYAYVSSFSNPRDDAGFVAVECPRSVPGAGGEPRRLWIYHLWGQHHPATDHYPRGGACEVFTAADYGWRTEPWLDDGKRRAIAGYDNATRYNDMVLRQIVAAHDDRPSVVIYFSDHGDEVYDFRDVYGRGGSKEASREYVDALFGLPFMIRMSDSFRERYPAQAAAIVAAARQPATTDLLGYTLLNLAGISTPYYRADRDFLSPSYRPHRGMTPEMVCGAD